MTATRRGKAWAVGLFAGALIGGGIALVTPAGAAVQGAAAAIDWKQVWKQEIKPRADKRYYTKKKANARYYTKFDANTLFETKAAHDASLANYYTKAQHDASLTNYYTKAQSDTNYYTKAQSDPQVRPTPGSHPRNVHPAREQCHLHHGRHLVRVHTRLCTDGFNHSVRWSGDRRLPWNPRQPAGYARESLHLPPLQLLGLVLHDEREPLAEVRARSVRSYWRPRTFLDTWRSRVLGPSGRRLPACRPRSPSPPARAARVRRSTADTTQLNHDGAAGNGGPVPERRAPQPTDDAA